MEYPFMRRYMASRASSLEAYLEWSGKDTNEDIVHQSGFREQDMVWGSFVLAFVVSDFVRATKLSEAEICGSFVGQIRVGSVNEFETKNGLKNRAA